MVTNLIQHTATSIESTIFPFFNPLYGINMAHNLAFGSSPEKIHNGIDDVLWAASSIIGGARWDFNSITQAHTGVKSIDCSGTWGGDIAQIAKGSNWDFAGNNSLAITMYVYITSWPISTTNSINIYGFDTGTSLQIGGSVNIGDYINKYNLNTWQKITIPLQDLDLENAIIDSFRFLHTSVSSADRIDLFIDDLQIEHDGVAPAIFSIEPPSGYKLYLKSYNSTFLDEYDATLLNGTTPNIGATGILNVNELTNGFIYHIHKNGSFVEGLPIKSLVDILTFSPLTHMITFSQGGKAGVTITSNYKDMQIELDSRTNDRIEFIISDDLSGFDRVQITGFGILEAI